MWIKHSRKWVWVFYSRVPFFVKIELLTYLPLYAVPPRPCWVGGSGLLYLPFIPNYEMERGSPHLPLPLLSFCGDIYQLIGNFFDLFANSNISAKIPIYWLIGILDCGETGCWSAE